MALLSRFFTDGTNVGSSLSFVGVWSKLEGFVTLLAPSVTYRKESLGFAHCFLSDDKVSIRLLESKCEYLSIDYLLKWVGGFIGKVTILFIMVGFYFGWPFLLTKSLVRVSFGQRDLNGRCQGCCEGRL